MTSRDQKKASSRASKRTAASRPPDVSVLEPLLDMVKAHGKRPDDQETQCVKLSFEHEPPEWVEKGRSYLVLIDNDGVVLSSGSALPPELKEQPHTALLRCLSVSAESPERYDESERSHAGVSRARAIEPKALLRFIRECTAKELERSHRSKRTAAGKSKSMVHAIETSLLRFIRQHIGDDDPAPLSAREVELLEKGAPTLRSIEPTEDPVSKAQASFSALLRSSVSTQSAAETLGVSDSRIRQRLTAVPPRLYGFKHHGDWLVPTFQFMGSELVPHVDDVVALLPPNMHPIAVEHWFTGPNSDLRDERSHAWAPLDWLKAGNDWTRVADAARGLE